MHGLENVKSPIVEVLQSTLYNRFWFLTWITYPIVLYLITNTQCKYAVFRNITYQLPSNMTRSKSLLRQNFSRNLNPSTSAQKMRRPRVLFESRQKDVLFSCNKRRVEYQCGERNSSSIQSKQKSLCIYSTLYSLLQFIFTIWRDLKKLYILQHIVLMFHVKLSQ
jgi:hypothetical protein